VRIGDVSLVQNSTKHPQCASEVNGENSCEILSLKVWNKAPLAPVPFRAFCGIMVYTYICTYVYIYTQISDNECHDEWVINFKSKLFSIRYHSISIYIYMHIYVWSTYTCIYMCAIVLKIFEFTQLALGFEIVPTCRTVERVSCTQHSLYPLRWWGARVGHGRRIWATADGWWEVRWFDFSSRTAAITKVAYSLTRWLAWDISRLYNLSHLQWGDCWGEKIISVGNDATKNVLISGYTNFVSVNWL